MEDWGDRREQRKKFVELAERRTQKALDQIKLLGNLNNKASYEYTEQDYKKIINTLRKAIGELQAKFENRSKGKKGFTL